MILLYRWIFWVLILLFTEIAVFAGEEETNTKIVNCCIFAIFWCIMSLLAV